MSVPSMLPPSASSLSGELVPAVRTPDAERVLAAVTGLVLCGGRSRRMGADKATLVFDGSRFVDRSVAALASVATRVLLATGARTRFEELRLECVLDEVADAGPLAGLAAGLAAARTRFVAVLACDMPFASGALVAALVERAVRDDLDAAVYRAGSGIEPLCAVYSTDCLDAVRAALLAGERRVNSFWAGAAGSRTLDIRTFDAVELGLGRDADAWVENVNTPDDLARVVARRPRTGRRSA
ncbi:MAG: molybdenum cofactor guanylyltransferase [Planctomycetes bacterium]|nr:molybdenum cofactor guanylyltransferase [Planctomycetota bacterium]